MGKFTDFLKKDEIDIKKDEAAKDIKAEEALKLLEFGNKEFYKRCIEEMSNYNDKKLHIKMMILKAMFVQTPYLKKRDYYDNTPLSAMELKVKGIIRKISQNSKFAEDIWNIGVKKHQEMNEALEEAEEAEDLPEIDFENFISKEIDKFLNNPGIKPLDLKPFITDVEAFKAFIHSVGLYYETAKFKSKAEGRVVLKLMRKVSKTSATYFPAFKKIVKEKLKETK